MKYLLLVLVSIILVSCSTMQSINVAQRTRIYPYPYLTTFKAAIDYCNTAGYPLLQADKDLGLLNTDYKSNEGVEKFLGSHQRYKINLNMMKVGVDSTKIIANVSWEKEGKGGAWEAVTISEGQALDFYTEIFDGIKAELK